jgi:hypothetical protein
MQHKRLKLSAVLLLGLGLTGLQAQTMYVKESIGTQTVYTLSNIRKMTFTGGNATVQKTDNTNGVYALSGLRYLNFTDLATGIYEPLQVQEQMLNAYPNPVSNVLSIELSGATQGVGMLSILNFEGKTVLIQQVLQPGLLTIDISHMPQGIYLCQYRSATERKTVKIIKQ